MAETQVSVTLAQLRAIADLAELPIPDDRLERLLPPVQALLRGLAALDDLDLDEVEPEMVFRARWEDADGD